MIIPYWRYQLEFFPLVLCNLLLQIFPRYDKQFQAVKNVFYVITKFSSLIMHDALIKSSQILKTSLLNKGKSKINLTEKVWGGKIGHATQNIVKSARVRTIITLL